MDSRRWEEGLGVEGGGTVLVVDSTNPRIKVKQPVHGIVMLRD